MCQGIKKKDQVHHISFCNWSRSNFMILTLFASRKEFNTHMSGVGWGVGVGWRCTSRESSISQAWTGSGCESVALGWPPTPVWVSETTHVHLQGRSLCLEHVSLQLVPSVFVCLGLYLGTWKASGEFGHCCWRRTAWRCVLVACCMGFDLVVLKYSDIQRLMPEIKQHHQKKKVSIFEQNMLEDDLKNTVEQARPCTLAD